MPAAQNTAASKKAAAARKAAKRSAAKKPTKRVPKKPAPKKPAPKKVTKKPAAKSPKRPAAKKPVAKKPAKPKAGRAKRPSKGEAPAKKTPKKAPPAKKAPATKKAPAKPAPAKPAPAKAAPAAKAPAPAPLPVKKAPARKPGSVICPLSGWEVMPAKANLSPRTLKRLRAKLLDERDQQLRQAEDLQAEAEELAQERDPGDTQFDEESGEGDTVNVERERDLLLSASARQIVDAIDRALKRMDAGMYGVCVPAGRRLSVERLEAIPYAEECVDCKARAERRR